MKNSDNLHIDHFDYQIDTKHIAQQPVEPRDAAKMLVYDRVTQELAHRHIYNLVDYMHCGDVLVLNNTRVVHARLLGNKVSGGKIEVLLLKQVDNRIWSALCKGSGLNSGTAIDFNEIGIECKVISKNKHGVYLLGFSCDMVPILKEFGNVPLPPYINQQIDDTKRYQTVYATEDGSVAAPTAGLHFTEKLLGSIAQLGVTVVSVTLHVGLDTFMPVRVDQIDKHVMHSEWCSIDDKVVGIINRAREAEGRIIVVGTTTVRVLETAAGTVPSRTVKSFDGYTNLFIRPGYTFNVVDVLLTNFHLPRSTLLMMVGAFIGNKSTDNEDTQTLLNIYEYAMQQGYMFYSFGDAMLIL